jgi:hypothetical protein
MVVKTVLRTSVLIAALGVGAIANAAPAQAPSRDMMQGGLTGRAIDAQSSNCGADNPCGGETTSCSLYDHTRDRKGASGSGDTNKAESTGRDT